MNAKTRLKMTTATVVVCIGLTGVRVGEAKAETPAKPTPVRGAQRLGLDGDHVP